MEIDVECRFHTKLRGQLLVRSLRIAAIVEALFARPVFEIRLARNFRLIDLSNSLRLRGRQFHDPFLHCLIRGIDGTGVEQFPAGCVQLP